jgi:hypothetical protein
MVGLFAVAMILSYTTASVLDCSPANSVFKLTSMSFLPDPVIPGQNSTLLLSMNVPEQVNAGIAKYTFTYNFLPFSPVTDNLCNVVSCPIVPGSLSTTSSYPIDSALSGSIQIKLSWKDNSSRDLICVNIRTTVGSAAKQLMSYSSIPVLNGPMCPVYQNMSYKTVLKSYIKKVKKNLKNTTTTMKAKSTKVSKLRGNA